MSVGVLCTYLHRSIGHDFIFFIFFALQIYILISTFSFFFGCNISHTGVHQGCLLLVGFVNIIQGRSKLWESRIRSSVASVILLNPQRFCRVMISASPRLILALNTHIFLRWILKVNECSFLKHSRHASAPPASHF